MGDIVDLDAHRPAASRPVGRYAALFALWNGERSAAAIDFDKASEEHYRAALIEARKQGAP